jgi:hypothetical protein
MMKNYISPEMKISLFNLERVATSEPTQEPVTFGAASDITPNVTGITPGSNSVLKSYNIKNAIELK